MTTQTKRGTQRSHRPPHGCQSFVFYKIVKNKHSIVYFETLLRCNPFCVFLCYLYIFLRTRFGMTGRVCCALSDMDFIYRTVVVFSRCHTLPVCVLCCISRSRIICVCRTKLPGIWPNVCCAVVAEKKRLCYLSGASEGVSMG